MKLRDTDILNLAVALKITPDHLVAMTAHAEKTYPDECCGLLLGTVEGDERVLVELRALNNAWDEAVATEYGAKTSLNKTRRYWIDPKDMLVAMQDARTRGLDVIGVYHSHPNAPATPSECDRQNAWPYYSYIILSVDRGTVRDYLSWHLDEHHQFQSEAVTLTDSAIR